MCAAQITVKIFGQLEKRSELAGLMDMVDTYISVFVTSSGPNLNFVRYGTAPKVHRTVLSQQLRNKDQHNGSVSATKRIKFKQ